MCRRLLALALLSALTGHAPARRPPSTPPGAGALIAQAMDHSEVMANLRQLSDIIGPRLSGSAAMRRANDWTAERFRAYGLSAPRSSRTPSASPGSGAPASLRLVAPFTRAITAHSWAWTVGTGGKTLTGPVVLVDLSTPDSLAANKGKVRGAWVLPRTAFPVWNPDGPAMTAEDSADLAETMRAAEPGIVRYVRRRGVRPAAVRARPALRPEGGRAPLARWWTAPRSTG